MRNFVRQQPVIDRIRKRARGKRHHAGSGISTHGIVADFNEGQVTAGQRTEHIAIKGQNPGGRLTVTGGKILVAGLEVNCDIGSHCGGWLHHVVARNHRSRKRGVFEFVGVGDLSWFAHRRGSLPGGDHRLIRRDGDVHRGGESIDAIGG